MSPQQAHLSEAWQRYRQNRDPDARADLIETYLPLVETLAAMAFGQRVDDALSYHDMLHYGITGLLEALDRYDPDKGADFKTYATYRIKGNIQNGIARGSEVASQAVARKTYLRERVESLHTDSGDTLGKLIEQSIGLAIGFMLDNTGLFQDDAQPSTSGEPYYSYELAELAQHFKVQIESLPKNQRRVIQLHYFHHYDFAVIAEMLNLSRGRVSQIHKEALQKLRKAYNWSNK